MKLKIVLFTLVSLPLIASQPSPIPLSPRTQDKIQATIATYEKSIQELQAELSRVQSLHAQAASNPRQWLHQITQEAIEGKIKQESNYRHYFQQVENGGREYIEQRKHREKPQPKGTVIPFLGR
jgi:hypothetical protein